MALLPDALTCAQWDTVFDTLSFGIVSMGIAKILFWLLLRYASKYQTAVINTGAVTCFATHHYLLVFNS